MSLQLYPFQQYTIDRLKDVRSSLIGDDSSPGPLYGIQIERFVSKYELCPITGCWLWTRALGGQGAYGTYAWRYNRLGIKGKAQRPAHVIMYLIHKGEIPKGKLIDHLCRKHVCGNPQCLELVTPKENQQRGLNGILKTSCKNGHSFIEENIYVDPRGWRECRICRYDSVRDYRYVRKGVI